MLPFLSGALMLGFVVGGAFFFEFWRKTHDRLFLMFGVAFALQAVERFVLVVLTDGRNEEHSFVYLFRLAAFAAILGAIVDKNRRERR